MSKKHIRNADTRFNVDIDELKVNIDASEALYNNR